MVAKKSDVHGLQLQHAFEPGASDFNKRIFSFFRFSLEGDLFNPLFGIGEESIRVQFKIKSIIKQCAHNSGLMVPSRVVRRIVAKTQIGSVATVKVMRDNEGNDCLLF